MAGQVWVTGSLGGYLTSVELSRQVRVAAQPLMRFRQFCRPEEAFGRNLGDTLQFDKVSNVAQQGRVISELETVPETNFTIYKDTVVAKEFSNSVPYTWTLEILAKLDIKELIINALKDDMAKTLDKAVAMEFKNTDLLYAMTGTETNRTYTLSTNGTANTCTRNVTCWDVKNIIDQMRSTYKMPYFDGRDYMCVATTTFLRGLKDDSEYVEAAHFGELRGRRYSKVA
jgi:HK97 family phage major capsid protein